MKLYIFHATICILMFLAACKVEEIAPVGEAPKNIAGSWRVIKATRNGTDVTNAFDFTKFRLQFDADGNYTLLNRLPFLVNANGKVELDDPNYPFKITFRPEGAPQYPLHLTIPLLQAPGS